MFPQNVKVCQQTHAVAFKATIPYMIFCDENFKFYMISYTDANIATNIKFKSQVK